MNEPTDAPVRDETLAEGAPNTAQVFLCWSGTRSLAVAKTFSAFLVQVMPDLKHHVFVSTQLEKGVRWFEEIVRELESAQAGILCLTAENLTSPWLHFEAGALAKGLRKASRDGSDQEDPIRNRIFTYLHGVTASTLAGPLAHYQSTSTTREDTWQLIKALAGVLFPDDASDEPWSDNFETAWPAFEQDLKRIAVPVQELLPDFERWFQRKTFDEPLQQCTNQDWPGRYDGARQTHDHLTRHIDVVRKACPRYQVDLYEKLRAAVDAYAMDIRALLFKAPTFNLNEAGHLEIEPKGILRACEDRREAIRGLLRRMLDPLAVPATEEAVVFWLADSFEQRKLIVHRLQHDVLARRDRTAQRQREARPEANARAPEDEASPPKPYIEARTLFKSLWNLDRIFGYLATEYLAPDAVALRPEEAVEVLREAVEIELERYRAQGEGASLMPTHYGLDALKAACFRNKKDEKPPVSEREADAVERLLKQIEALIEQSRPPDSDEPRIDKGGQIRRTVSEIRSLLIEGRS